MIDIETSGFSPATDTELLLAAGCMQGANPTLNPTLYDVIHTDAVAAVPVWRMPLRPIVIDTSVVARTLLHMEDVPTLEAVCQWLDIPVANRHQADADVRMTAQVWARELELCRQVGMNTVSDVVEWTTSQV